MKNKISCNILIFLIEKYSLNCVRDSDNYTYSVDENNKKITAKNVQNEMLVYAI